MSYQLFLEKLTKKIKKERDDQVEAMAAGYAHSDYQYRVGIIRGYDETIIFAQRLLRELTGEEQQ